jgi:membrane protein DedA with SNARE-associated domain
MIATLIASYGYLAVFIGTLLEGETILIAAGFAAQRGLLSWPVVIAVAIAGATLGDQFAFLLGRWKGNQLIERFPLLARHRPRIHDLLERYDYFFILIVRFLYGLRIAGPIILGSSKVPLLRFAMLNVAGAVLWAVLIFSIGNLFGHALEVVMGDLKQIEEWLIVAILVTGLAIALGRKYAQQKNRL